MLGYTIHKVDDGYSMILEYTDDDYPIICRYAVETHIGSVKSVASTIVKNIPYLLSGGVDEGIR